MLSIRLEALEGPAATRWLFLELLLLLLLLIASSGAVVLTITPGDALLFMVGISIFEARFWSFSLERVSFVDMERLLEESESPWNADDTVSCCGEDIWLLSLFVFLSLMMELMLEEKPDEFPRNAATIRASDLSLLLLFCLLAWMDARCSGSGELLVSAARRLLASPVLTVVGWLFTSRLTWLCSATSTGLVRWSSSLLKILSLSGRSCEARSFSVISCGSGSGMSTMFSRRPRSIKLEIEKK